MGRMLRIDFNGATHHVMCRGNNGAYILSDDLCKAKYLELVCKYKERYDVSLLAYCMMDNHVHLLIRSGDVHMGHFMKCVQTAYSKWYHKQNKTYGRVFAGRFKSCLCSSTGYYYNLLRYIHINPIDAGLTSHFDYRWSSYAEYLSGNGFCDLDTAYQMLAESKDDGIEQFKWILGRTDEVDIAEAISLVKGRVHCKIQDLMDSLDYDHGVMQGHLLAEYYQSLRKVIIREARLHLKLRPKELARYFDVSERYVSKL
ncbi:MULTISPECIES: transposase [unclassified Fusibacter]|uniref:transposase n=1 Tax=unclassified Fusibacter TaxID=2624464 RepID=UPI0013E91B4C|nr:MULTISPECIES: transposase [unclassified Fusibacter]MCK8061264.1 transposase [Fusibacter sp. A2]NPE23392.1 hypothetical protein [Fusibacter sp. A1]